ncbi:MAG: hypothetical protein HZA49_09285 [Planctomycetes bacterium]|nr:hypothetical protein [Planctomycetota bacterium]
MKKEESKKLLEQEWENIIADAESAKDSPRATINLMENYKSLDTGRRLLADQIIAEWITSKDDGKRFDALALVEKFNIRSALPQLRALEVDLKNRTGPDAYYQLEKVRRKIKKLESESV